MHGEKKNGRVAAERDVMYITCTSSSSKMANCRTGYIGVKTFNYEEMQTISKIKLLFRTKEGFDTFSPALFWINTKLPKIKIHVGEYASSINRDEAHNTPPLLDPHC